MDHEHRSSRSDLEHAKTDNRRVEVDEALHRLQFVAAPQRALRLPIPLNWISSDPLNHQLTPLVA
jgi:hypothetical protein